VSDPVLKPIERRLARRGGNPQDATFWLLGIAVVGGLLLITATRWITGLVLTLVQLAGAPPGVWVRVAIDWAFGMLTLALLVRVIGSWFGASPYTSRIMRLAHRLTDWIVVPIRRVLPTMGMIDLSPLVAYLALVLIRSFIGAALR
jgi:YggT family protein